MNDKPFVIIVCTFCLAFIIQFTAIMLQDYTLELRVIERNGIYVVQSNLRFGLISDWDDEKKFKTQENAQKYMNEWYSGYKAFKEKENRIEE